MNSLNFISSRVKHPENSIKNTVELLSNEATIPFIARYRKEATGNLDELEIEEISNLLKVFQELEKRKLSILKSIKNQDLLSAELQARIEKSTSLVALEDIYLPYKKKRKTKADEARAAGLEGLAKILMAQSNHTPQHSARKFITSEIVNEEAALEGAKFIIAEWISEKSNLRAKLRQLYMRRAVIISKVVKSKMDEIPAQKYKQYFEWEESLKRIPSHRYLAMRKAEGEGFLKVKVEVDKTEALEIISGQVLRSGEGACTPYLVEVIDYAFMKLLRPAFNTEFLNLAGEKADKEAIQVFAENLEQLLLSPPLGEKRILAIDPGFKSGCKVVCIDENGALLHNENIYPHPPQKKMDLASKKIRSLVNAYKIEAIAIGNGTASRETETFVKKIPFDKDVNVFMVNEAGASVYSASKIAREEFSQFDITVRGAVSIGRRLSDPLAELVKIDPKSLGVGQYQHEVDQNKLREKLDLVVMSCVNRIGVNVNTASKELLSYVSGIGPSLADNILEYRKSNGTIKSRNELMKIPRLGARAFEQAAGFLRITNPTNPLDNSAVHPERYKVVEKLAKDRSLKVIEIVGNKEILKSIPLENYVTEDLGLPTLKDIIKELEKPGADPRTAISSFEFDPSIKKIEDLRKGMRIPGIINNITNFGCFVDIGIKESGLIHISKLASGFVSDVGSVVKLNQQVIVTVVDVDEVQKRIQLSLID